MAHRNAKKDRPGFEEALDRLEEIKAAMDNPDTGLEQMIALYEEGLTLIHQSRRILADAELRIQTLEAAGQEPPAPAEETGLQETLHRPPATKTPHDDDEFTLL